MVKLTGAQVGGFLKAPPSHMRAVLIYGPDRGLVRERAQVLAKTVVDDLHDPFRVATLTGRDIAEDPTRLIDESQAISMMGGRRVVRIKETNEGINRPLGQLLETTSSDTLVIIEGEDLPPRSGLRKLVEAAENAAALPCYSDDGQTLQAVIQHHLAAAKLAPDQDAIAYLLSHLGGDRQITLSELEKVILYKGLSESPDARPLTLDDVQAVVGDSSILTVEDAVKATAMGQPESMERALDRCFSSGLPSIQILRAHLRHFQRLHVTAGHMQNGQNLDGAMNKLFPRVFFKDVPGFKQQLNMWSLKKLSTAIGLLQEAEVQCKTTGNPDVVICRRVLLRLARAAKG